MKIEPLKIYGSPVVNGKRYPTHEDVVCKINEIISIMNQEKPNDNKNLVGIADRYSKCLCCGNKKNKSEIYLECKYITKEIKQLGTSYYCPMFMELKI